MKSITIGGRTFYEVEVATLIRPDKGGVYATFRRAGWQDLPPVEGTPLNVYIDPKFYKWILAAFKSSQTIYIETQTRTNGEMEISSLMPELKPIRNEDDEDAARKYWMPEAV
jgi:hypothetical protein